LAAVVLYFLVLIYFIFLDSNLFDKLRNKIMYHKSQELIVDGHMNKGCFLFTVLKMQVLVFLACFISFYSFFDSSHFFSLLDYVDKEKKPLVYFVMFFSIISFLSVVFLELLVINTFNTPMSTLTGQLWRVGAFVGGGYLGGLATDHYIMLEGTYHPVLQPVFDVYRRLRVGYTYRVTHINLSWLGVTHRLPVINHRYPLRENT